VGKDTKPAGNACRSANNSVDGTTVAIIFVPGIMGSRLKVGALGVWDPDAWADMISWACTSLAVKEKVLDFSHDAEVMSEDHKTAGVKRHVNDEERARGWGGVRWDSYGVFLEFLQNLKLLGHSIAVYAYGYDWRQPIAKIGCQMAADITGQSVNIGDIGAKTDHNRFQGGILAHAKTDKCVIITHSMGGLVARAALKASKALQDRTLGVLHGVQPATGAPVMFRRLITGAFAPCDDGHIVPMILGDAGDDFATLISVIPGALQLLPSDEYRKDFNVKYPATAWLTWSNFQDRKTIYCVDKNEKVATTFARNHENFAGDPTKTPPGGIRNTLANKIRERLAEGLKGVEKFHTFIERWSLPNKTWAFYGIGHESEPGVHFDLPPDKVMEVKGVFQKSYLGKDGAEKMVYLDKKKDLDEYGFNPKPPAPHICRGPYGDGTVPEISGAALFDTRQDVDLNDVVAEKYQFGTYKQFKAHVEHEPAYRDKKVQAFCEAWLKYVIK
jgi:hypothetical protein